MTISVPIHRRRITHALTLPRREHKSPTICYSLPLLRLTVYCLPQGAFCRWRASCTAYSTIMARCSMRGQNLEGHMWWKRYALAHHVMRAVGETGLGRARRMMLHRRQRPPPLTAEAWPPGQPVVRQRQPGGRPESCQTVGLMF